MNETQKSPAPKYMAFITHAKNKKDAREARWLARRLENFRVPVEVVSKLRAFGIGETSGPVPERLQVSLSESPPDKKPTDISRYLIVVCSPLAAASERVNGDARDFVAAGREKYIVPYIIEGNPVGEGGEKCYPDSLSTDILGVTVSAGTKEEALIRVMARLLDVKFSLLYQRHLRERRRDAFRALAAAVGVFAVLSVLCGIAVVNETDAARRLREADKLATALVSEFDDDRLPPETLTAVREKTRKYFEGK
jgi:hypothetical protein